MKRIARKLVRPALISAGLTAAIATANVVITDVPLTWQLLLAAAILGAGSVALWRLYIFLRPLFGRVTSAVAVALSVAALTATTTTIECLASASSTCTPASIMDTSLASGSVVLGAAVPIAILGLSSRTVRLLPWKRALRALRAASTGRP